MNSSSKKYSEESRDDAIKYVKNLEANLGGTVLNGVL